MAHITYPATAEHPVTDVLHGVTMVDPYRWLEDGQSAETGAWVDQQNALTQSVLDALPVRGQIHARWMALAQAGSVHTPRVVGDYLYYHERAADERQPRLMRRAGGTGTPEAVINLNAADGSGLVALDWYQPTRDGTQVAYGTSTNGDEWSTLRVRDLRTGQDRPLAIPRCRMASVAWLPDGQSFYYSRYPLEGTMPAEELAYHRRLYWHDLTQDDYTQDPEVFGAGLDRRFGPHADITADGRYLVISVHMAFQQNEVWYADLQEAFPLAQLRPIFRGIRARFAAKVTGHQLTVWTNWQAPNGRILTVDLEQPPARPEDTVEVVPEHAGRSLLGATRAGAQYLLDYLEDASSRLVLYDPATKTGRNVVLPEMGSVSAISVHDGTEAAYLGFQSFTTRPGIWRLDLATLALMPHIQVVEDGGRVPVTVTQEWTTSPDGTRIPMFVVRRSDLGAGPHPTILSGYGGFNIARTPTYSDDQRVWVEMGGIYVVATLRGGSEYGEAWHRAGMLEQKQHVFDDYIAAAEHLIAAGHTDTPHLAIRGGSNGGLLVGAAMTQRPDLYRAVVCAVPLLDMVRYHKFLIADLWTTEYGSADNPEQFPYIYAYSPYHHVEDGTHYPAVLFCAAHQDSRVDPLHARKMAAKMQKATGSDGPILLRIEFEAGHGVGKPVPKQADMAADVLAFLADQLGLAQ